MQSVAHHIWLPYVVCVLFEHHMVFHPQIILFLSPALIHMYSPIWLKCVGKALEIKEICINGAGGESKHPVGEIRQQERGYPSANFDVDRAGYNAAHCAGQLLRYYI